MSANIYDEIMKGLLMSLYTVHRTQALSVSSDAAWSFFSDPRNLPAITPPWLEFKVTSPVRLPMHPGQILTYEVSVLPGLRTTWVTEITHVREGEFFVDEQRFGPYRFWHHQHLFSPVPGGTEMEDLVHYALPYWPVGDVVRGLVRDRLERIFDYRQEVLRKMFPFR